ncbi:MAG TPA: DUF4350 domain-containing protein [Pyrinomonadaceae bacterium]|nr:DUF4350 domain-containing protein [Pyrinomonadaceae bacterium]
MRQRFAIVITAAVVVVLLIALNTASYVAEERQPDTEFNPDRSTYNAGSTGVRALYDLLAESGRQVTRWREQTHGLLNLEGGESPSTFVVVGKTRVSFDEEETQSLLRWVTAGGRLVVIDRRPDPRLLPRSEKWAVSTDARELPRSVNPAKPEEMTAGVEPVSASQPSLLTRNVESVQPSRFAGGINISGETQPAVAGSGPTPTPTPVVVEEDEDYEDYEDYEEPPPPPVARPTTTPSGSANPNPTLTSPAPVVYLESDWGSLLIDYPHGAGRIVLLSDPYMVANGGIRLADNLQLALNVVGADAGGLIAFDEYHQARAATGNPLFAYFAGTPILWMVAQGALVVLVLLWTGGRRFARPLPVPAVDRRSSLEFVASMAELQQRARAYDLAIENIYTRLRRVLVRHAGLGHNSTRMEIAERVAARSSGKLDPVRLEQLMRECEEYINSGGVNSRKALELVTRLREVERILGLRLRSRETRQAAEGLQ